MLVEDDKSLREIYSIRLVAEGYDIISAGDGEEALALAVQYKPELIIADVMMPKISGFDMLDILRSQPETSKIKVIMMTALSSDEQRQRGEALGAERYLVKSQVGIEDVIATVHEVLGDVPNANAQANMDTAASMPAVEAAIKEQQPAEAPLPDTTELNAVETTPTTTIEPTNSNIPAPTTGQIIPDSPTELPVDNPAPAPAPVAPAPVAPVAPAPAPAPAGPAPIAPAPITPAPVAPAGPAPIAPPEPAPMTSPDQIPPADFQ
jgi:CheY-like chemotaxis protein